MFSSSATTENRRHRIVGVERIGGEDVTPDPPRGEHIDKSRGRKDSVKLPNRTSFLILLFTGLIFLLVIYCDGRLPRPLSVHVPPTTFSEDRTRSLLKKLISVGPRPAGSYENEVLALKFITKTIESISAKALPHVSITLDIQKTRGSFNLGFIDGLTHHYREIQNVIVKFESPNVSSEDALLINCHFDSVPASPGASDDAVSCAIMLELLSILSLSTTPLKNTVIFLFNGAEENILPASHGFITQHIWAEQVRAFINLEACGAGGRELVFQSGPEHPWLIEAYAEAAPYPFASVIGQEVFQSGVIPGDTDFRIFRDYGHIPGLDIAYMKNGYVYHTKYDTEDKITPGSIQRAGENVLAVVRRVANSDILRDTSSHRSGNIIYFDFLGLFLIYYPQWIGVVLNILVISLSFWITYSKAINSFQYGVSTSTYLQQLGYTFLVQLAGCVASLVVVTLIAVMLDAMGRSMSWYSKPYLIFFLYMTPTIKAVVAVFHFALPRQKKFFRFTDGIWAIESLYFEVSKLVWTFFCLIMTVFRVKSSFFCTIWVIFPMLGRLFLDYMYDRTAVAKKSKGYKWLMIHLISLVIPLIFNMYLINTTFSMFVPIMGRSGSTLNPDLLIGYKAASMTLITMSYICPLVMVMRKPIYVVSALYMSTIITVILVLTTRLGFPYSASPTNLAPQRSLIMHTAREFYSKDGSLIKEDSAFFLSNLDRNSPNLLIKHVPPFHDLKQVSEKDCDQYIFCGLPMYYPASSMLKIHHYLKAPRPRIYQDTSLKLIHSEEHKPQVLKLLFRVEGPDHMGIFISPAVGVKLTSWSFVEGKILNGPSWIDNRPTHYVFYSHGISPTPWEFWLEFKVPKSYSPDRDLVDISVTGHIIHGIHMQSPDLQELLQYFPSWSYPLGWTATYKAFKF
ncbi:endoplasmic reticulum metallopeptidase 1 [Lepeophtheirus salmonis]|uniref:FXNA-like protease n=1 Tax=Lepeophtheirus salmonis TaxID=72036 RepID=A0A0K2UB59_LEPSM|nr:endoplasmic reticulum metallopeptidase 1-like [Lepeophtheirus salmonis]XP_040581648.1 endoplasmic reticulum metallopeptidase 1-like [Lepeophtheirus salmonis]XP_040581649.1 endoplasmic reticulum metallopeptidase 1-like [Lepeophtheirus salmonis]